VTTMGGNLREDGSVFNGFHPPVGGYDLPIPEA
jgi:hypothetical protein